MCGFGAHSLVLLLIGIVLLDVAAQSQGILNQAQIFALSPHALSRVNTAYVTSLFVGAAAGSVAASVLWASGGWTAVCIVGGAICPAALVLWLVVVGRARIAAHHG